MPKLYHPDVTPNRAVERTLAAWILAFKDRTGQDPPAETRRAVRARIERIARRRDNRLTAQGWS